MNGRICDCCKTNIVKKGRFYCKNCLDFFKETKRTEVRRLITQRLLREEVIKEDVEKVTSKDLKRRWVYPETFEIVRKSYEDGMKTPNFKFNFAFILNELIKRGKNEC